MDLIKLRAARQKSVLEQNLLEAKQEAKKLRDSIVEVNDRLVELKLQKELNVQERELKRKEEGLFLEQARIDVATENEIDLLHGINGIEFDLYPIFEIAIKKKQFYLTFYIK